jgi:ankyrin repeat protein
MTLNKITLLVATLVFFLSCTSNIHEPCFDSQLMEFAKTDDLTALTECLSNGSDIYLTNDKGENLYQIARASGGGSIMDYLIKTQIEEWQADNEQLRPAMLYKAINFNNTTIVRSFTTNGFDVETKYFNGISPIVEAIFADSYEVVALLLESGVDVNYQFDFRPLITIAAMFDQQKTIELLLSHGADINDIDGAGMSSLIFAAMDDNLPLVKYLLSQGANRQIKDVTGRMALDYLSDKTNEELVTLLSK